MGFTCAFSPRGVSGMHQAGAEPCRHVATISYGQRIDRLSVVPRAARRTQTVITVILRSASGSKFSPDSVTKISG